MWSMFANATSFDQNLGGWYIVMDSTSIDRVDIPGMVGTISAQNRFLDGQNPTYRLEQGGDSDRFEIAGDNQLSMVSATADRTAYQVTISATGDRIFEDGNNRRTIQVTLEDVPDAQRAPGQLPFITTWRTDTANQTIAIPLRGTGMTIHWGDGTNSTGVSGTATHTYANPGTHTVSVYGGLEAISLDGHPDAAKLVSIDQWGDVSWTTMRSAFSGAANMVYAATDDPDLSRVTDMSSMFAGAASFNGDISAWDVSGVTNIQGMFAGAASFNQPLDVWDVSGVTDMSVMFNGASAFNQPLDSWDTSSVTGMSRMFSGADSFNQPLDTWDVSSVTSMGGMFLGANFFDQDISSWNVSSVTNTLAMFAYATSFDQPLDTWDVSGVTDMSAMFAGADSFDQSLGAWYITISSSSIDRADIPGMVGTISAQNPLLDGQNPTYRIEQGGDSHLFEITGGNILRMVSVAADRTTYTVTISATGDLVFEDGNNRRTIQVTLAG